MKAKIYEDRCIGCGQCEATCSDVFRINDEGIAEAIVEEVAEEVKDDAQMAADGCPTDAIEIKNA